MTATASTPCARCQTPCSVEHPDQLLRTVVCAHCAAKQEVREFLIRESSWHASERRMAAEARDRFNARARRLERLESLRLAKLAERSGAASAGTDAALPLHLQAALARARNRK